MVEVSVILPNYNHGKFLEQRILSILGQTFSDFELIILDDCSTDNSRDIIEKFRGNPKISHIVYNVNNSGSTFRQWQKGFEFAQGEYIWIAESDDYCSLDFLSVCMSAFHSVSDTAIVYTNSALVDENGSHLLISGSWLRRISQPKRRKCECYTDGQFIKRMVFGNEIINASAVVFRKDKIPLCKTYEHYRYCGDWLFWCTLMKDCKVQFINQELNFFRQHLNKVSPVSERKGLNFIEGLDVYKQILDIYSVGLFYKYASLGSFFYRMVHSKKLESRELKLKIYSSWKQQYPCVLRYLIYYSIYIFKRRFLSFIQIKKYIS